MTACKCAGVAEERDVGLLFCMCMDGMEARQGASKGLPNRVGESQGHCVGVAGCRWHTPPRVRVRRAQGTMHEANALRTSHPSAQMHMHKHNECV